MLVQTNKGANIFYPLLYKTNSTLEKNRKVESRQKALKCPQNTLWHLSWGLQKINKQAFFADKQLMPHKSSDI